jgi:hypothetical protein
LFSWESKIGLFVYSLFGISLLPHEYKKWTGVIFIMIILTTSMIAVLMVKSETDRANVELLRKLQSTTRELDALQKKYIDLLNILGVNSNGALGLPIQTRLGIRLMDGGRYQNYLWVTGEVENTGNITLYNVRLRFTLQTTNGTDVKEDIIGTMQAHQIVTRRYTAYSSLGAITGWNLEPVATYQP